VEIQLADQHIFVLDERIGVDEIRQRAMDKRTGAFGGGIGGLLQRPKPDEIELVDSQRRLEPFWHVGAHARYVYDRTRQYTVPTSGPEVRELSIHGESHAVTPVGGRGSFVLSTTEHCRDEFTGQLFLDGVSGAAVGDGAAVVTGPNHEVTDLTAAGADGAIVVPPEQRASFVVRQLLATMMKPVQADALLEESVTLDNIDLYLRPWWAFEFHWKPKDKRGVVELDALTGQLRPGQALMQRVSRLASKDAMFDIGADTVGLLVPGGSIAVKVARIAIENRSGR
jgi:hypothetical protein